MLSKYIALTEKAHLHLNPGKNNLIYIRNETNATSLQMDDSLLTLNKTAAEILTHCHGIYTGNEILTLLGNKYDVSDPFVYSSGAEHVIGQLVEEGAAVLLDDPAYYKINITGDFDYATPIHATVELLAQCNLRCAHCYREASPDIDDTMSLAHVKNVFSTLRDHGVISVELTGGEISIHPHFYKIVELAAKMFDIVGLLTNGTKITQKLLSTLEPYKHKIVFSVSLDGPTAEVHEELRRVEGSFQKTCNGIRAISEAGFFVRAAMSVYNKNVWHIEDTLLLAKELGASLFGYSKVDPFGRGERLEMEVDVGKLEQIINYEKRIMDQYSDFIAVLSEEQIRNNNKTPNCGMGWKSVIVDPFGNVRPCVMLTPGMMDVGNLHHQSYREIFDSPLAHQLLNMVSPVKSELCSSECSQKSYCRGCALRAIEANSHSEEACPWVKGNNLLEYTQKKKELQLQTH
ncbi:radical SAM protein [Paenibacillus sp. FSL H8-0122]|uniref:radical SAM/SPASM domain-containing protein n=1 Tax=Paenibacillus sp. FSL H8-0122 TaxID=2954510 RepID=UPI0030F77C4A